MNHGTIRLVALLATGLFIAVAPAQSQAGTTSATAAASSNADEPGTYRIRIVAANLTSDNFQSYREPGNRILQGIDADIALLQEFNIGPNASRSVSDTNAWVEDVFGSEFSWTREPGNEQIPNGIVSRWPILSSGEWSDSEVSNRDYSWARIDIPGEIDLWVVSVHWLTTDSRRPPQATELVAHANNNVPSGAYLVIGGDFNTDNHTEGTLDTLDAVVNTDGPYPVDQSGNAGTNSSRSKDYDGVYANPLFETREIAVQIGNNTFPEGAVIDTRVYTPISDLSPALAGDSGVSGMQHMAVIRDFQIIIEPPEPPRASHSVVY